MQNIGASNAGDVFYRYKMPKVATKIEGRGNGIKTNVINNVDVAKALERPPTYTLKYLGCELGAQTNYDDKTGTSIVNGAHNTATIADLLEGFIKKFVQCYSCGNPETMIKIDKRDNITLKCKACGAVSAVDPRHKLNTYILKNPPEPKMSKSEKKALKKLAEAVGETGDDDDDVSDGKKGNKKKKDKKDKKEKKEKKEKKNKGSDDEVAEVKEEAGSPDVEDDGDDDRDTEWMTDTSAAAVAARAQEQLSSQTAQLVTIGNLQEADEDTQRRAEKEAKKEAKRAKKAEKEARKKLAGASIDDDEDEKDEDDDDDIDIPALSMYILSRSPEDAAKALNKMEVPGGTMGTMRLLWQVVFSGCESLSAAIPEKKEYLSVMLEDANSQLSLLGGLEYYLTVAEPEQLKETAKALKALYDLDVVDEEVILAWSKRPTLAESIGVKSEQAASCRKVAIPVITWLEEADEESD